MKKRNKGQAWKTARGEKLRAFLYDIFLLPAHSEDKWRKKLKRIILPARTCSKVYWREQATERMIQRETIIHVFIHTLSKGGIENQEGGTLIGRCNSSYSHYLGRTIRAVKKKKKKLTSHSLNPLNNQCVSVQVYKN